MGMRVLHVINSLEIGGAEVLLCDLIPCLRERGLDVSVALLKTCDSRLERTLRDTPGCEIHGVSRNIRSPAQISALARLVPEFDVVHSHLFPTQYWVALAAKLTRSRARLVTTEHNPDNRRREKPIWKLPDRWMYTRHDSIVCNSRATADALELWIPDTQKRTAVIPNGIVLQRFCNQPRGNESPRDLPVAVFVARLDPQKDHVTLLRAISGVPQLRLKLVGDGILRKPLEKLAEELGLRERVEFLGYRDDIPSLLSHADFYVHSTLSDGFGIAALEAMAVGLPVIASDVPGLSWVVGDAGILCKPGDQDALAQQMSLLASNPELRKVLSAKSKDRAKQFDIKNVADAHIRLYESLIYGARKPAPFAFA